MDIIENRDAQFVLLAGFIIAVGLVITTLLLNSIAFEGNMAVDAGSSPIKYDIANLMRITADEMKSAYRNATAPGGYAIDNFNRQMRNFNGNVSKIYALRGEGVNVSWDLNNWQNMQNASFTDNGTASGASNWTVIENVSRTNITVNVVSVGGGTFQIGLINASGQSWTNVSATQTVKNVNVIPITPSSIVFRNGSTTSGNYSINGTASGRSFTRARDYILNATLTLSTSRVRANITIPVSVPW
ncbi:MAG: hypothetical protein PHU34_06100 [Candidatus Methanoperedens sp.]|nr:hypothetical protein [Candidatus Methanoperedens sp.]